MREREAKKEKEKERDKGTECERKDVREKDKKQNVFSVLNKFLSVLKLRNFKTVKTQLRIQFLFLLKKIEKFRPKNFETFHFLQLNCLNKFFFIKKKKNCKIFVLFGAKIFKSYYFLEQSNPNFLTTLLGYGFKTFCSKLDWRNCKFIKV